MKLTQSQLNLAQTISLYQHPRTSHLAQVRQTLNKLAFVILIGVLMAIANPKHEEHRSVVKDRIMTEMLANVKDPEGVGEGIGLGLGLMIGAGAVDVLIDMARYQNFFVFSTLSTAKDHKKGSGKLLSVGVFGNVIPLIDEDLKR